MNVTVNVFWFRRDLRLNDNAGLYHALTAELPVLPIFIFDRNILDQLENPKDARVDFIYHALKELQRDLIQYKSSLEIFYGKPAEIFSSLSVKYQISKVFTNEDYEPYARDRDEEVERLLKTRNVSFQSFKDHVIFSKQDILKDDNLPYTVFTPYSKKWINLLNKQGHDFLRTYPSADYCKNLLQRDPNPLPGLKSLGFSSSGQPFPSSTPDPDLIGKYGDNRDFPGRDATSHLGVHLRFGTISIRRLAKMAVKLNAVFLNELIWRDFYQMILWHFPRVGRGYAFKEIYEGIHWRNNEPEFSRWCRGETGYPLVDAGMRQLNETGFMHNRVRMVTASFLSKHLLIDWRWGEAYFAGRLLDFDLASNNGGWQWAAGCGCDAAPYFRIFNPSLQQKNFDPDGSYVKRWLPDLKEPDYPKPIVEHVFARVRAITVYREGLNA